MIPFSPTVRDPGVPVNLAAMNQMTLMNPTTIEKESTFEAAMNAVILYDDACAAKAIAMLDRSAHRADEVLSWTVKPWRLDMLEAPWTANSALTEAADAHLVLLSLCHPRSLPEWVLDWLEQWALRRRVQEAALAVWDSGNGGTLSAAPSPVLSEFAHRHNLSFIFGDADPSEDRSAVVARNLREREVFPTPTLQATLRREPPRPAIDWGINE